MGSAGLAAHVGAPVSLKLDCLQPTGSFKVRGAANKILSLPAEQRERGVVAVSTGNHGRAVGHVARQLDIPAAICISERVPQNKVEALRATGAEVVIHGQSQDEAGEKADELVAERGWAMIPPFDDAHIIAGQGTIGLELLLDAPDIDTVLVPLSGGGLIAGVALALKSANPNIRVIGVSMERAAVMYRSLAAGEPVMLDEEDTLADSLLGGIGLDNRYTFEMVRQYVDDAILVTEQEIACAMAFAVNEHHLIVEGAAVVGIAALQAGKVAATEGGHVATILSGGNVDTELAMQIARGEVVPE